MAKKKSIKKALVMSIASMVACLSMFAGTTFAWFTDSVTSRGNIIKAGTLDAEMYWTSAKEDPTADATEWKDASKVAIFNYDKWEPEYTEAKHIKIANTGSLAFKYEVRIEAEGEVSKLAEVIDVYYSDPAVQLDSRDELGSKIGTLADVLKGDTIATGSLLGGDDVVVTILLKMQEDANNDYQGLSIGSTFAVKVIATQMTYEEDSFGDDYDKDASIAEVIIKEGGNVTLTEDFNQKVNVLENVDVTLNLNNNAVKDTVTNNGNLEINEGAINVGDVGLTNNGNATLNNVTMNAGTPESYSNITIGDNAETVYNNVTIVSGGGGIAAAGGAKVVFNSGEVYLDSASTSGRYNFYAQDEGSIIIINDGTFGFNPNKNTKRAYICAMAGTTVYVNGGNFGAASSRSEYSSGITGAGTVIITGGTFGFDPSNWVADGYEVVKEGSTYTVKSHEVSSSEELKVLLKDANKANGLNVTLKAGKYSDLLFTIPADYVAKNVTIVGEEGTEIEGFTVTSYTADSNIVVDGLTFKNVTFSNDVLLSTKSMANVTFENCDFINDARVHQNDSSEKLTNLVIKDCTFSGDKNGASTAIMLENTENVTVSGSTFTNIDFNVIQAGSVSGNVVFDNNSINGTGDRVFRFVKTANANISITNNTIVSDGDSDGELAKATDYCVVKIENNTWNGKADEEVIDKLINIYPDTLNFQIRDISSEGGSIIVKDKLALLSVNKLARDWVALFSNGKGTSYTDYSPQNGGKGNNYYYTWAWKVVLDSDIDFENKIIDPINVELWNVVDGQNHIIKNAVIITDSATANSAGLFILNKGIQNIKVDNIHVTGSLIGDSTAGVLSGSISGKISNITITNSSVAGGKYTGGVVGYGYTTISDCVIENTIVKGGYKLGGVIGYICADGGKENSVTNCSIKNSVVDGLGDGKFASGKDTYIVGKIVGNYNCNGDCNNNVVENIETSATEMIGKIESGCIVNQD